MEISVFCTKCEIDKEESFFTKRKDGSKYVWCKSCHAEHKKKKREENLEANNKRVQELRAIKRKERQDFIIEYLYKHPCIGCGEKDPIVLEFDHRDPTDKKYNVSTIVSCALSLKTIKEEINKCDVLCANCHKRKTAKQVSSYKYRRLV